MNRSSRRRAPANITEEDCAVLKEQYVKRRGSTRFGAELSRQRERPARARTELSCAICRRASRWEARKRARLRYVAAHHRRNGKQWHKSIGTTDTQPVAQKAPSFVQAPSTCLWEQKLRKSADDRFVSEGGPARDRARLSLILISATA
jgi:hypothetical protein